MLGDDTKNSMSTYIKYILLFLLLYNFDIYANNNVFSIKPYLILIDDNKAYLKFKLNKDADIALKIKSTNNNYENIKAINKTFLASKVYNISLGKYLCGKSFYYQFIINGGKQIIEQNIKTSNCRKNELDNSPRVVGLIADTQYLNRFGYKRFLKVAEVAKQKKKEYNFDLMIHAGDVVQTGAKTYQWEKYFNVHSYLENTFSLTTVGNHAYWDNICNDGYLPCNFYKYKRVISDESFVTKDALEIGNMVVDYHGIRFIAFNNNFSDFDEFASPIIQYDWLSEQLKIANENRKKVILVMHEPPISSSWNNYMMSSRFLLKDIFVPLFERYKDTIKLIISGHTHIYERSFKNGINYFVSGPAGGILSPYVYVNKYAVFKKAFVSTFSLLFIYKDKIKIKSFDKNSKIIDSVLFKL